MESNQTQRNEIRVVLLGSTGAGKSASGNSMVKDTVFKENRDPRTGTTFSETRKVVPEGWPNISLCVTDTPGLNSTGTDQELLIKQLMQFIAQLSPGPHVIVIVISTASRITTEVQNTVETFCQMFGKDSKRHMMFLFTHIDTLRDSRDAPLIPIEKYVENLHAQSPKMEKIFQECGNRYMAIDNTLKFHSEDNKEQNSRLIKMFQDIIRSNGGTYYSNEDFQMVEDQVMKPLDQKTGDRSESRSRLGTILMGFSAGGMSAGGICGGLMGASVAAEAGVATGVATATGGTVGAVVGAAAVGTCIAATATVAGVGLATWGAYKAVRYALLGEVKKEISKQ